MARSLQLLILSFLGFGSSLELVSKTFDDVINSAEKNAFVMFCSAFCPWCKNYLNATWTSLMQQHEGSDEVLVAHIDCGEPSYEMGELQSAGSITSACKRHEVDPVCDKEEGHIPTIKYFDVKQAKWFRYKKGWEQDTLQTFIDERLMPQCNLKTAAHCSDKDLNFVHKHEAAPKKELDRLQKMLGEGKFSAAQLKWLKRRIGLLKQLTGDQKPEKPKEREDKEEL